MGVHLHMHNKYTQYTHIYYVKNIYILDAINLLTALVVTMLF